MMTWKMREWINKNSWNNMMHQVCLYFKTNNNKMNTKTFNKNMNTINNKNNKKKLKISRSHKTTKTFNKHKTNKTIKPHHKEKVKQICINNIPHCQSLFINRNNLKNPRKVKNINETQPIWIIAN